MSTELRDRVQRYRDNVAHHVANIGWSLCMWTLEISRRHDDVFSLRKSAQIIGDAGKELLQRIPYAEIKLDGPVILAMRCSMDWRDLLKGKAHASCVLQCGQRLTLRNWDWHGPFGELVGVTPVVRFTFDATSTGAREVQYDREPFSVRAWPLGKEWFGVVAWPATIGFISETLKCINRRLAKERAHAQP